MKNQVGKAGRIVLILLCIGIIFGCASKDKSENPDKEQEITQAVLPAKEQQAEEETGKTFLQDSVRQETEEEYSPKRQMKENIKKFYDKAERQGIDQQTAKTCLRSLPGDNLFENGKMALRELWIDDIDNSGVVDMLVMVADAQEKPFYGSGGLWFYMNDDEPYCFSEESCPYQGDFELFWEDIDNDQNVEIVFSSQGIGVGATGDIYKAIFKYKNHAIEQMRLPTDLESDYGCVVEVIQEAEQNSYSAYCPYFDEWIPFHGENVEGGEIPATAQSVGENVRGFYDLCVAEYHGKKALQASEYLMGEGAVPHCVATAEFLITWQEDGTPKVVEWWIEEDKSVWANTHESRICYMDGYYYYASQSDHYFLYRVKEDGSSPQCLAKLHASDICAQDGVVYFVNLSDENGIYRINADGTGLKKLCAYGHDLQLSAEYVYFCDEYHMEYDTSDPKLAFPTISPENDKNCLYRMKRDGSERTLIANGIYQCALSGRHGWQMRYSGAVYCSRYEDDGLTVYKMDLNGHNAEALYHFDYCGEIAVWSDYIYCIGSKTARGYCPESGELHSLAIAKYTDYCFYKGGFYGLCEQITEEQCEISIYRVDLRNRHKELVYEESVSCGEEWRYWSREGRVPMSDLYATQQGVFFRRFISEQEGCQWLGLTEDGKAWELEDKETIPVTLPAKYVEYGERLTVMHVLESTQGYEAYLSEDLEYEEYYTVGEDGEGHDPYQICLPQFNSRIAGYKKINRYFQNAYKEALAEKEEFFQMHLEEGDTLWHGWYQRTDYTYVYIGEKYITVGQCVNGYWGGIRSWVSPSPVTFDKASGEVVSLEDILGMTQQEAVAHLMGSVYKYMEGIGWRESFFLKDFDLLTAVYDPEQFFLFPDGIGIYYGIYDIGCGADGDFLFIVPWEDLKSDTT
ncbi:MAG: DUF5050 domain-containing protein [Lachnospiraceae bacterium]|nr:DUF5050 domain-containing protein [Lachnospiraceae bacterium]